MKNLKVKLTKSFFQEKYQKSTSFSDRYKTTKQFLKQSKRYEIGIIPTPASQWKLNRFPLNPKCNRIGSWLQFFFLQYLFQIKRTHIPFKWTRYPFVRRRKEAHAWILPSRDAISIRNLPRSKCYATPSPPFRKITKIRKNYHDRLGCFGIIESSWNPSNITELWYRGVYGDFIMTPLCREAGASQTT